MHDTTRVWASYSKTEPRIMLPIRIMPFNREERDLGPEELDHWAAVTSDYKIGAVTDSDILPKIFVGRKQDTNIDQLSDFFIGGGFLMISQRCADVFARHDLGESSISPVEIFQGNRMKLVSADPYYILNIASRKTALIPELCNPTAFYQKILAKDGFERYSEIDLKDDDCVLSEYSLLGPDLWIDTAVFNSFFMNAKLVDALEMAGFAENMVLRRCRVVDVESFK